MQSGLTPLHLAAQEDKVSVAEVLLNHGADVNPQTKVSARLTHETRTTVTLPDLDFDGPHLCGKIASLQVVNKGKIDKGAKMFIHHWTKWVGYVGNL